MKINITENVRKHGMDLKNNFKNIVTYMKDNGREKKSKKKWTLPLEKWIKI